MKFGPENKCFKTSYLDLLSINKFQIFWQSLKAEKTSNKDHSFYDTVSLKKHHSFGEPQLTQHYKKYFPATQTKALLTLQIFQQVSGCCPKKHFPYTISRCPNTAFSKHLERKCLCIPVNLHKNIFIPGR